MTERLKRDQRICQKKTFQTLFKHGKWFRGRFLNLWILKAEPEKALRRPQIAIIVSRKVSLRATIRNLWKRRIREAFRRNQPMMQNGTQMMVQARPSSQRKEVPSYQELEKDLKAIVKKAHDKIK